MKTRLIFSLMLAVVTGVAVSFSGVQTSGAGKNEPVSVLNKKGDGGEPKYTGKAALRMLTEWYEAVGTIRPRTESRIGAQLTAQIVDILVHPGDRVSKGQIMIVLDDRQMVSRVDQSRQGIKAAIAKEKQARQSVIAAEAAFNQAESEYNRVETYHRSQAATRKDLEQAESAYRQAEAGLQQAREALTGAVAGIRQAEEFLREATIAQGFTKIRAPVRGEILERLVEPGDMALPGKSLITLRTTGSMRIEAFVREGLIGSVKLGAKLPVVITTLDQTVDAEVEEVVPYADPRTRTFLIKAVLPDLAGLFPGMFAKLMIPVREHPMVMIPVAAVRRVGQLELVKIKEGENWKPIYIKTGRNIKEEVEVLSGLNGDETIGWED